MMSGLRLLSEICSTQVSKLVVVSLLDEFEQFCFEMKSLELVLDLISLSILSMVS